MDSACCTKGVALQRVCTSRAGRQKASAEARSRAHTGCGLALRRVEGSTTAAIVRVAPRAGLAATDGDARKPCNDPATCLSITYQHRRAEVLQTAPTLSGEIRYAVKHRSSLQIRISPGMSYHLARLLWTNTDRSLLTDGTTCRCDSNRLPVRKVVRPGAPSAPVVAAPLGAEKYFILPALPTMPRVAVARGAAPPLPAIHTHAILLQQFW